MAAPATISYLDGWFGEESDGTRPFRWMGREAHCRVGAGATGAACWLRVTAGHAWPRADWPVLAVSANGQTVGERTVRADFSDYLFALPHGEDLGLRLAVDRTTQVAGDERPLGIMVRTIEIVDVDRIDEPVDAGGWYGWETHEYFPFRWMGLEAHVLLPGRLLGRGRFVSLPVYCETAAGLQTLTVRAGDRELARLALLAGWHVYDFALAPVIERVDDAAIGGAVDVTFMASALLPAASHESDPRELSVGVGRIEIHDDARRHQKVRQFHEAATSLASTPGEAAEQVTAFGQRPADDPVLPHAHSFSGRDAYLPQSGDGWYVWEFQDHIPFRWTKREASVVIPAGEWVGRQFCTFPIFSEYGDLTQIVTITCQHRVLAELPLGRFWNYWSFELPEAGEGDLHLGFHVNKMLPPGYGRDDPRHLGVRVGPMAFHDDGSWHRRTRFFYENAVLNARELRAGATVLKSFPTNLGIDLFGKCNIKPPCVYCLWDQTKDLEGTDTDVVVDDGVLEGYAEFFDGAQSLVNCSFGEPLLHPRLAEILELVAGRDKLLELSTNGQAFTPANVRAIAGKPVVLYVSLDAASAEVYGRLRNDRWQDVVTGLTFLRDARRRAKGLPKLNMVFMPMRANLCDLEAYFRLCRMVEANLLVLRPLNYLAEANIRTDRGGYHFDYGRELLSNDEIRGVVKDCEAHAAKYKVLVANQFDFGLEKPPIGRTEDRERTPNGLGR